MALIFDVATVCNIGGRDSNQDNWAYRIVGERGCWIVCDGAGGHGGGAIASQLAAESALLQWSRALAGTPEDCGQVLSDSNRAVLEAQMRDAGLASMRTTIVLLTLDAREHSAAWAHSGDSRLYRFRSGIEQARTLDHSLVQHLMNTGVLEGDQTRSHPRRNVLLSALGGRDMVPSVSTSEVGLEATDSFLLCSDGFWQYILEEEMAETIHHSANARDALDRMVSLLRQRVAPNHDNYTALLIRLEEAAQPEGNRRQVSWQE